MLHLLINYLIDKTSLLYYLVGMVIGILNNLILTLCNKASLKKGKLTC